MAGLLASPVITVRTPPPGERTLATRGTLTDPAGVLLADVHESLSHAQQVYRAGYDFTHPKNGLRLLGHRLEVRDADGAVRYLVAKNRQRLLTGLHIRVQRADGEPVGAAHRPWHGVGRQLRLTGAPAGTGEAQDLGTLAVQGILDLRCVARDPFGQEVARIEPPPAAVDVAPGEGCRVTFTGPSVSTVSTAPAVSAGSISDTLRLLVLGCAIALYLPV